MIRKTGDKGTFYSGEKGTKKIGVDNIRTGKPDVSIDLVDGGTVYTITPNVEVKDLSEGVVQWLEIGRKSKFILRRYMLLDFIDAAPASRYSALEPFLDLEPYLGIEEALHQWKGDLDTKIAFISSKLESVKDRIMVTFKLGEAKALKADELLRCLNTKLLEVGLSTCLCLDKLKETKDQINIALGGKDVTNRIQKIGYLRGQVERLGLPNTLSSTLKTLIDAQIDLEKMVSQTKRLVLGEFLIAAYDILKNNRFATCPVCEKPIDQAQVLQRLKERIEADRKFIGANNLVKSRKTLLLNSTV